MPTIWKFEFKVDDDVRVKMPTGASIIHVGSQKSLHLCLWAVVEEKAATETRRFFVRGTGHPMLRADAANHIGTVLDGSFVWHIFENKGV